MSRREHIHRHYTPRVHPDRPGHEILDWASAEAQEARFSVLGRVLRELSAPVSSPSSQFTTHNSQPTPHNPPPANRTPLTLLDAGCGLAELRQWLIRQGLSVRYTGCDLTPAVLHEARRRQPGADLLLADLFHAAPFPPRAFDVTFSSGLFNLELGNNEAFLDEALPILARLTRRRLVVNLLHVRTEQKYPLCHYFDPDDIRRRFAGLGRGLDVIDDYLPNDFTLVWHLPEGKA